MSEHQYYEDLPTVNFAAADALNTVPTVEAQPLYNVRDAALLHTAACYDSARTLYLAVEHLRGNDTPVYIWRVPEGQPMPAQPTVIVWPHAGASAVHKADDLELKIGGQTGRDLHVYLVTHEAISGERDNQVQLAVLQGFVTAQGAPAENEGTVYDTRGLVAGEPAPGPGLTEAQVKAAARAALEEWMHVGANFEILKKAAREGVTLPGNLVTTANMGQTYADSFEIMQQIDNRVYATLNKHHIIEAAYKILGLQWPPRNPSDPQTA